MKVGSVGVDLSVLFLLSKVPGAASGDVAGVRPPHTSLRSILEMPSGLRVSAAPAPASCAAKSAAVAVSWGGGMGSFPLRAPSFLLCTEEWMRDVQL